MSIYDGIDLDILEERLTAAQDAYHALATGQHVVSVRTGDTAISFAASDPNALTRLATYIRDLQRALGLTTSRVYGVNLGGGKGL